MTISRKLITALVIVAVALGLTLVTGPSEPASRGEMSPEMERMFERAGLADPFEEAIEEQKAPEDFYLHQRLSGGGTFSPRAAREAVAQSQAIRRETLVTSPALAGSRWR